MTDFTKGRSFIEAVAKGGSWNDTVKATRALQNWLLLHAETLIDAAERGEKAEAEVERVRAWAFASTEDQVFRADPVGYVLKVVEAALENAAEDEIALQAANTRIAALEEGPSQDAIVQCIYQSLNRQAPDDDKKAFDDLEPELVDGIQEVATDLRALLSEGNGG